MTSLLGTGKWLTFFTVRALRRFRASSYNFYIEDPPQVQIVQPMYCKRDINHFLFSGFSSNPGSSWPFKVHYDAFSLLIVLLKSV